MYLNIKGSLKMCFQLPLAIVICATEFLCESLSLFACFRLHLRPAPGLYHTVRMVLVDPCDNLGPAPELQRNLPANLLTRLPMLAQTQTDVSINAPIARNRGLTKIVVGSIVILIL